MTVAARHVADTRKVLIGLFNDPARSLPMALDLMGIGPDQKIPPEQYAFARTVAKQASDALCKADLFIADADMCSLVDVAAPTMPDQVLMLDDPISPDGLVLFVDPLPDRSGQPPYLPVCMLSWSVIPEGHQLIADVTGTSVLITSYIATGDLAKQLKGSLAPGTTRIIPNATVMWTVGTEIGAAYGRTPDRQDVTPGFYQRLAAAFWTLCKQPLSETEVAPKATPADRRRYARAGVEDPNAPVRIVRLRRRPAASGHSEPTGRTLHVRFVTRGHWRNQWLPSLKSHRVQYIAPHLKGPPGAPLKGGEKVLLATGKQTPADT